ncbi:UDP-N-acetylglucosamine--N-acetylmuramyl-(pentapeptide) pyrophosphoryl-undecaprenol N-acetylglucosamine transferase [Candidatus Nomurabacteria bacterium]|nr:UDP-N-acetylglucosamine--N-acetylmuramyl-(pentapeptide) pyrophosphoryl-undecaprenol N-acetylglucosamine transferase [Candidatus Nomurabacteria bacterium]
MSKKSTLKKKILFTGGGSGGHISAATAIIDGLRDRYSNVLDQILYVGSNLGMSGEKEAESLEEKIVSSSDIPFVSIRAGKLQRYLSLDTIKKVFGVLGGVIDARKVINDFKPDIIVSTGGFVTVPVAFVGWIKKIPVYIHEQTAAIGLTNKIASRFAKRVYTTFPQSAQYLPKGKALQVGNAVRKAIFSDKGKGETISAVKKMLPEKETFPIVLIAGGGQGSHLLNIITRQMLRYLVEDFQVILQTGDNKVNRDYEILLKEKKKLPESLQDRFLPVKFIPANQIGYIFKNIDIYVGRAGANFVYEMGLMRKPSILIPIPWVTHDEQNKNAQSLVDVGLGKILPEGELTAERLFNELKRLNQKIRSGRLRIDESKLEKNYRTDAVEKIMKDLNLESENLSRKSSGT